MRKKEVNALEEYAKVNGVETGNKCLLNLVVVGHVDSGKSTMMGHLLFLLGTVTDRVMHKYEQDSRKVTCIFLQASPKDSVTDRPTHRMVIKPPPPSAKFSQFSQ